MHALRIGMAIGTMAVCAGGAQSVLRSPMPAVIELGSLDGPHGFVINGAYAGDGYGMAVSGAGDVNGDGYDDLIIGASSADPNALNRAGVVSVVFGGPSIGYGGDIESEGLNGITGFRIEGLAAEDRLGSSVSGAGDVNGDGYDDLVIGSSSGAPNGRAYVVFGGPGVGAGGTVALGSLDGTTGFAINGTENDRVSGTVSVLGDINGDGFADVFVGAPFVYAPNFQDTGKGYVFFGGDGIGASGSEDTSGLDGSKGFVIQSAVVTRPLGFARAVNGDVNGDGIADFIIGTSNADANGVFLAGSAHVVFGGAGIGSTGTVDLALVDGTNGFAIYGANTNNQLGTSVGGAGDVNDDGYDDVIVGAPGVDPDGMEEAGAAYVVFGGPTGPAGGVIVVSALDGTNGFVCEGIGEFELAGRSVSGVGDVNHDGIDDLVVGVPWADPNGKNRAGQAYVIYGASGLGAGGTVELSSIDGTNGFIANGDYMVDAAGAPSGRAGDLNGDGVDDMFVTAPEGDPEFQNRNDAGEVYVVFGRDPAATCAGDVNSDTVTNTADFTILAHHFGQSVAPNTNGDLTGNGVVNLADFNILAGDFGCGK